MKLEDGRQHELPALLSAMLDGQMTAAEESRLADLLRDDPRLSKSISTCAGLTPCCGGNSGPWGQLPLRSRLRVQGLVGFGCRFRRPGSRRSWIETPETAPRSRTGSIFRIIVDTAGPLPSPLFSLGRPLGGWLFSYAAATVITGMAILGAWAYKVSHDYQLAAAVVDVRRPRRRRKQSRRSRSTSAGSPAWPIAAGPIPQAAPVAAAVVPWAASMPWPPA